MMRRRVDWRQSADGPFALGIIFSAEPGGAARISGIQSPRGDLLGCEFRISAGTIAVRSRLAAQSALSRYLQLTRLKMKSTLKVVLSLLALGLVAGAPIASAQDQTPPPQGPNGPGGGRGGRGMFSPEDRIKQLDEALKLTDDQKTKITALLKTQMENMAPLFADQSMSREDRRAKMMEIGKATNDAIKALLTPEQQTKFDALPRPGRGGPRGPGGPGGPGGEKKTD
jgi:periplasmic protein CpxP/Spy